MKNKNLFLVIETNQYTGNFEREMLAYVFGHEEEDSDYVDSFSDYFDEFESQMDMDDITDIANNIDTSRFGRNYGEYYGTFIDPHPLAPNSECNCIYVAVNEQFTPALFEQIKERCHKFCEFAKSMNLTREEIKVENIKYYVQMWQPIQ